MEEGPKIRGAHQGELSMLRLERPALGDGVDQKTKKEIISEPIPKHGPRPAMSQSNPYERSLRHKRHETQRRTTHGGTNQSPEDHRTPTATVSGEGHRRKGSANQLNRFQVVGWRPNGGMCAFFDFHIGPGRQQQRTGSLKHR